MSVTSDSKNNYNLSVNVKKKSYKDLNNASFLTAIKDMDFKVPDGQFCCLLGPSGCGKTTLLNILSGLDNNYDGNIQFDDDSSPQDCGVGYMFQEPHGNLTDYLV